MTRPSVVSDMLMLDASLRRCPVAPVASLRSLPARSTRLILLHFSRTLPPQRAQRQRRVRNVGEAQRQQPSESRPRTHPVAAAVVCVNTIENIAWERDDTAFIAVDATVRMALPSSIARKMSLCVNT
jgi:hypothetical protein